MYSWSIQFILYLINLYFIGIIFLKYGILKILIGIYSLDSLTYIRFNLLSLICKLILNNNYIILSSFPILLSEIVRKIGNIMDFILNNFTYIIISVINIDNNKIIIIKSIITIVIIIIIIIPFLIKL